MKKHFPPWVSCLCVGILLSAAVTAATADETALFTTSTSPDALIILDLSGSMDWNPAGGSDKWGNASCSGTFGSHDSSNPNRSTDCSRLAIAKRAIFDILDDNDNSTIDSQDEGSLGVRIGYMRFKDGNDTDGNYSSGNIQLVKEIGVRYSRIYCDNANSCTLTSVATGSVSGESANGGTPLASALNEAKLYLDANKAADAAGACRQKFVILITDGSDTYACGGDGSETQSDQYKRRRASVAKAKALADAGYKVFVVGFGASMPDRQEKTLNWMAYYGGTDNPNVSNSGTASAYNPAAVTSCDAATTTGACPDCFAEANDPGNTALSGYAFLAADADQLANSLKTAMNIIREANFSFSQSSIQSVRTQDENFIYEGSFQPVNNDPFWLGHLKKFTISANGDIGSLVWDAGPLLQGAAAAGRNIKTYKAGALTAFNTTNITRTDLGVAADADRDAVVGYIRGEAPAYNQDSWKLGDVFRSTPITVGTPSVFFDDIRDTHRDANGKNAFAQFRENSAHVRTSANGKRIILAGANDGQLHAFKTGDGSEAWSFIPPNQLPRLKNIAHAAHPTLLTHSYFVDGPVTVADVWLGPTSEDGTYKTVTDWQTILIFGEARGTTSTAWSSSASCDSGFSPTYTATYQYYCGYFALDVTDSLNPAYKWRLTTTAAQAPYLGDAWSKVMTGRVLISGRERWVGFFGGGYNAADCSGGGGCDARGKGFFVVDLRDGTILWSYTRAGNASMNYSLAGSPAIVDTDNDGFIDTVYVGDLGGSMWRFKMCLKSDVSCGTANWAGGQLFGSSTGTIRPIYTMPSIAKDKDGNLWVYWGTGDKMDPTAANAQEKFFGLKDNNRTTTYGINDLDNITTGTYSAASTKQGWYINLPGGGVKVLADPTVFGGVVYFTAYEPASGGADPCSQAGDASLFGVGYTSGGGTLTGGSRSMDIGTGIPSAPIISMGPGGTATADLYVTVSSSGGGGGGGGNTIRPPITPPGGSNRTNMLYWRDRRLQ